MQKRGVHVRTCRDTPPMNCVKHLVHDPQLTHQNWTQPAASRSWDTEARSKSTCEISTQSAQPLPRYSRRNICDIPSGSTRHVPQWALPWFGIGSMHGRRDGDTHQRRPLVNRAYGFRDISLSKAWPRPAGQRAGRSYSDFLCISVETRFALHARS